jgi:hypothetical protein
MPVEPPALLVVTPTLGVSPWLPAAVASVAALGPRVNHVLVAPRSAVAGLRARFPAVQVLPEPAEGSGMYAAINAGAASPGWAAITYLNDDDLLLPRFRSVLDVVSALAPGTPAFAYGGVRLIDADGRRLGAIPISRRTPDHRALYAERLEPVYQHGTVFTRAAWERLGGCDATLRYCGDSDLLARACLLGLPARCVTRAPVAAFRLHAGQLSQRRAALGAERALIDARLGLCTGPRTWRRRLARMTFRLENAPLYVERIARHGFVTFDDLLAGGGRQS